MVVGVDAPQVSWYEPTHLLSATSPARWPSSCGRVRGDPVSDRTGVRRSSHTRLSGNPGHWTSASAPISDPPCATLVGPSTRLRRSTALVTRTAGRLVVTFIHPRFDARSGFFQTEFDVRARQAD